MYTILSLIGIGAVAYNFDKIKIFYLQQMGNYRATEITINFFVELLKENKDINFDIKEYKKFPLRSKIRFRFGKYLCE